ncbi:hypothetical protein F4818DRAFT_221704 [Hypoxylon cercidicola]|nr:hypothetical protein F4818DRAFT_221704 [Hypoxylon cercidicola]
MASFLRHQSSLRDVINFCTEPPLNTAQRTVAKRRFYHIVEYFETNIHINSERSSYNRPQLVRFTYEYALSEESRDNLLRAFFRAVALSIDDDNQTIDFEELRSIFFGFADHLLDSFFLPCKASYMKHLRIISSLMFPSKSFYQKDAAAHPDLPIRIRGGRRGANSRGNASSSISSAGGLPCARPPSLRNITKV